MQIKYKILISVVTATTLAFSHLYTYYLASEKENFKFFLSDISYSYILLDALEDNKTEIVKSLLANNINRVFIETENIDMDLFKPICEYINKKNNLMLKKYDFDKNSKASTVHPEVIDIHNKVVEGRKKMIQYCNFIPT